MFVYVFKIITLTNTFYIKAEKGKNTSKSGSLRNITFVLGFVNLNQVEAMFK